MKKFGVFRIIALFAGWLSLAPLAAGEPAGLFIPASPGGLPHPRYAEKPEIPAWLSPLREAVYNQEPDTGRVMALYQEARNEALRTLNRAPLYIALSRGEYYLGLHYRLRGRAVAAALRFSEGVSLAAAALNLFPTVGGWSALADNTLQLGLTQGLDERTAWKRTEQCAQNILALDRRNTHGRYLAAARSIFAPVSYNDPRRGIQLMEAILLSHPADPDPALLFDLYLAIGYGYFQQKRYGPAESWWKKAEERYPENQSVQNLLGLLRADGAKINRQ
jgi:tetratricopeptide (TPR) repeat protein